MGALCLHSAHYAATWTDDAYITFRYVRNFAAGHGMAWNEGERLEGITNLGWALMLVPFAGFDLMIVAKLISLLLALATIGVLARWSARNASPVGTAVTLASMVLVPWVPLWTMQGLETVAVMFLVTLGWTRYAEEARADRGPLLAGLALGIAPAVRPDAALVAVLIGGWHLVRARGPRWNRRIAASVALVIAAGAILIALKLYWFGELIPNTYHVKVGSWPPTRGIAYFRSLLTVPSPWFPALLLLGMARGLAWAWSRDDRGLPALVGTAGFAAIVALNGDFMPNFRMFVPFWPAATAALGLAADDLAGRLAGRGRVAAVATLAVLLGAALLPEVRADSYDNLDLDHVSDRPAVRPSVKIAPFLAPWASPMWGRGLVTLGSYPAAWTLVNAGPAAAVAYTDIGLIGYLNDGPVVDLLGLTDRVMAGRDGVRGPDQWAYLQSRVTYVLLDTKGPAWGRYRDALASSGWKALDGCDTTWVFANPALAAADAGPTDVDLKRRLDASLVRVSRNYGAQVAIVRELAMAGVAPEILAGYLDAITALQPAGDARVRTLACDVGLGGADCGPPRPACESGGPRVEPGDDAASWPSSRDLVAPGQPPPPPVLLRAAPEDALGPPLDGPPLPADPLPAPAALPVPPAAPRGPCDLAKAAAAEAWSDAADAWASQPSARSDAARRLARIAATRARAAPGEALAAARAASEAALATGLKIPAAALANQALRQSELAAATCGVNGPG